MKRVISIPNILQTDKYYLIKEYAGFGIYQRKCASGFFVHQNYMITNEKITIVSEPYNSLDDFDLMDAIDEYNETGKFNLKAINRGLHFVVHPSGKAI